MSQAAPEHRDDPQEEEAARRRERFLARVHAQGGRLRTYEEILAEAPDIPKEDLPTEEELDEFIRVIYDARDRDRPSA